VAAWGVLVDVQDDARWAAVDMWPLAVIAMDLDGRVSYVNPAAETLYGHARDQLVGAPLLETLVPPEGRQPAVDILAAVLAGQAWDGEFDVGRGDGSTVRVHVTDFPWWEGDRVVGVVGVSRLATSSPGGTDAQRLRDVAHAAYDLAAARDLPEVARAVTVRAAVALGAASASLSLLDGDGMLRLVSLTGGRAGSDAAYARFAADTSTPVGEAVLRREMVTVVGADELERRYPGRFDTDLHRSAITIPLLVADRCLGVIGLAFGWLVDLGPADVDFLRILADTCAQAVDRLNTAAALDAEMRAVAGRAEAWDRLQVLQKITGELTGAESVEEIAQTVVDNAAAELGADSVRVYVRTDHDTFRSVAWHGRIGTGADGFDEFSVDDDLLGAEVARTGQPVVRRRLEEIYESFPQLAGYYPTQRSLHIHPVRLRDRTLGILGLTFTATDVAEDAQLAFVQSLADALAQALERAMANERVRLANERLAVLADASLALSQSLDFQSTVDAVTELFVPRFADWAVVQILRDGTLENVGVHHPDPAKVEWLRSLEGRWPVDMEAETGAPAVIRTGVSELYPVVPTELVEAAATDDEHLAALRALGMASVLVVPLAGRSGPIGAVSLIYAESGRHYGNDDVPFVEDVARRAAYALETADTFRAQSGRLATVAEVADAAQRAILAEPPERVGRLRLAARYRGAHAEARVGGDLFEVVATERGTRLLIGDVKGKGLAAVRTATVVLGAFRAAAEDVDDVAGVISRMDEQVRRHLGPEDFVTTCLVDVADGGEFTIVSAGHPAPVLVRGTEVRVVDVTPDVPLGLGGRPLPSTGRLVAGDRLLLFTDGMTEARGPDGEFVDVEAIVGPLSAGDLGDALDGVVARLDAATGGRLDDDLALLAVEFGA
jgi:PAS domain S-box-containing protein